MPRIDLTAYKAVLGDPSAYFAHAAGGRVLVVAHVTGAPEFVLGTDGKLYPYSPILSAGVSVVNPPGFTGFPEHDRTAPEFDLGRHAEQLPGAPGEFFVHFEAEHPLVVRHADGVPVGRIVDGKFHHKDTKSRKEEMQENS